MRERKEESLGQKNPLLFGRNGMGGRGEKRQNGSMEVVQKGPSPPPPPPQKKERGEERWCCQGLT